MKGRLTDMRIGRIQNKYTAEGFDLVKNTNLEFIEIEKRRVQNALQRAEIAYSDRMVEAQELDAQIAEMLKSIG